MKTHVLNKYSTNFKIPGKSYYLCPPDFSSKTATEYAQINYDHSSHNKLILDSSTGLPNGVQVDPQGSTARFQGVHIKML